LCCLDLRDRFLQRLDLGLEQFDLCLGIVERLRFLDRLVGGGVRRIRLRFRGRVCWRRGLLRPGRAADDNCAACEQRVRNDYASSYSLSPNLTVFGRLWRAVRRRRTMFA